MHSILIAFVFVATAQLAHAFSNQALTVKSLLHGFRFLPFSITSSSIKLKLTASNSRMRFPNFQLRMSSGVENPMNPNLYTEKGFYVSVLEFA